MKIAFNVSPLQNDNSNRGIGSYINLLLASLNKLANSDFQIIEFTNEMPKNIDIVHYPFFDPFFLTLPIKKDKPTVVTVHDLIPLKFSDKFPRGIRGELKWQIQKNSLKMCQTIITDSQNSKKDINEITGINLDKITVVPLAASEDFKPINDQLILDKIQSRYHLPKKYLLYVGDVNWNKNISGLLKAYAAIGNEFKLVLVGGSFLKNSLSEVKEINKIIDDLGITNNIIKLGFVPDADLVAVYNLASVYIQPSFYEGFGLPVLEAMSCGCPVLSSNKSSLPEIGGNAIGYFDPENTTEMSSNLISMMEDVKLRNELRKKGLIQAKKFSWDKTAKETLKVYEKIFKQY